MSLPHSHPRGSYHTQIRPHHHIILSIGLQARAEVGGGRETWRRAVTGTRTPTRASGSAGRRWHSSRHGPRAQMSTTTLQVHFPVSCAEPQLETQPLYCFVATLAYALWV